MKKSFYIISLCALMLGCGNKTNQEPAVETVADTTGVEAIDTATVVESVETTPVVQECQTCGGTGEVECSKCNGKGYKTETFTFDYGDGSPAMEEVYHEGCKNCGGHGQDGEGDSGHYRKGKGKVTCPDCGGSGNN